MSIAVRLLITGVPGTGKTTFGERLAERYGFYHYDLEDSHTLLRWGKNPIEFVQEILKRKENSVVTWGFVPDDLRSVKSVLHFKAMGFRLVWFDGNRPAALRWFQNRNTVHEICFYVQMLKIESSKIIEQITPTIVNPFDIQDKFKDTLSLLEEIKKTM